MSKVLLRKRAFLIRVTNPTYSKGIKEKEKNKNKKKTFKIFLFTEANFACWT